MDIEFKSNVLSYVLIVVCATSFVNFFLQKRRTWTKIGDGVRRDIRSIPSPKQSCIPFIGHSLELLPITNMLKVFSHWGKKYKPIFRLKGLGWDIVILNSAPYVQALLKSTNPDHLNKYRKFYNLAKDIFPTGKSTLLAESNYWKLHRKPLNKLMTCQYLLNYMPILNKAGSRLVEATEKQFSDALSHVMFDTISVELYYTILEMSTGLDLYGTQIGAECHHDFKTYMALVTKRISQPWLIPNIIWKLHPSFKVQKNAIDRINRHFTSIIEKHKENDAVQTKPFPSLLKELISQGLSQEVIRDELIVMIIAGHDTSSMAVTMTCLLLALNPEHQQKCYDEIAATVNFHGQNPNQFEVSFDNLSALKYLEWCILEAMRLFPPAIFLPRELHSPLKLGDKLELPAGTNVAISPYLLHKNEEYFPNPETFDPLRFSPEVSAQRHPYAYLPFSAGVRNCYGYKFALMQIKVAMAYLLRRFVITTTETIDSVGMLPNVVMTPERSHLFRFVKRSF